MTTAEEIFGAALDRAAAERAAFLDVACAGQTEVRARVEALLDSHDATGFMAGGAAVGRAPDPAEERPSSRSEQPGDRIGRYRLEKRIGEGGFGMVWMAEQIEPVTRSVALKIIKAGMDTREVIARFEAERQALAMMDHPNIAKVFDAGEAETGRPFFVMELVKGIRITRFCDEQRFGTRRRLELFADVCLAVNHAHQKGVIHRDLKPSNIMVTLEGNKPVPKVIDFGIAKATQGRLTDLTLCTRFEHFVGTPAYMSPEQTVLNSPDIDTRSDVYGLGILLYELMTGKPPFDTKSLLAGGYEEMCHIIREVEPPKPSTRLRAAVDPERTILGRARGVAPEKLGRLVEPDLDWIVMKAIEKDRSRRYDTPNALALDIQRFLSNEPVSAGPPGPVYRFHKYVGRNKAMLRVAAVISVVLVVATAVSTWQAVRAWRKQVEANTQATRAEREEAMAKSATERLRQQLRQAAQSDRVAAHHLAAQGRFRDALVHLARACEYAPESSAAAEQAVILGNTAAFHPPVATLTDHGAAVFDGHFSAEGRRIVTASDDHIVRVWDAVTSQLLAALPGHTERVRSVQFSPDGGRIVSASEDRTVRVWDAATGRVLHVFTGHTDDVQTARFSADGGRVVAASVDDTARVWEVPTGRLVATLSGHHGDVNTAEFNAEGTRIITASDDDTACVWDAETGQLVATLTGHEPGKDTVVTLPDAEADVNTAHFSPDGLLIVTASNDNTGRIWKAASGAHLLTLRGHQDRLRDAEFSPDGTRVVTNSEDGTARVWDARSGEVIHVLSGHVERLRSAHFNPDGLRIVTASDDKTARVWEATTGQPLVTLSGHQDKVWTARFSPDGARIVTSSEDGSAGLWDLTWIRPAVVLAGHRHRVWDGRFSPDGRRILTTYHEGTPRGREAMAGRLPAMLSGPQDRAWSAVFSPDSARVITASNDGGARVWDAATGRLVAARPIGQGDASVGRSSPDGAASRDHSAQVWDASTGQLLITLTSPRVDIHGAQFSPDGEQIVTASNDTTGRVWNASNGQVVTSLFGHGMRLRAAEFSWDGGRILTTSDDLTARVWNAKTGTLIHTLSGHADTLRGAHFSLNGEQVVTASDDKTARVWDAATGRLSATLAGHQLRVRGAEFSPRDGRIVTNSDDKTARVWDAQTGQLVHLLSGHIGRVRDAQFSPDGERIVTTSDDRTARVWDATNGLLIATLPDHEDRVCGGRFSPDGTRLVTSSEDGTARVWELPGTAAPPPPWFSDFLRLLTAGTLNGDGELREMPAGVRVALRARVLLAATEDRTRYGEVARYHLTPGPDKPVRPGATVTCREAADSLISPEATRWQTERAYALDPAHPLIQIALARFAEAEAQAEFLRAYGLARIATNAPTPILQRAAALLAVQPGQEAKASMLLERAAAAR